jgi:hypothetical protein
MRNRPPLSLDPGLHNLCWKVFHDTYVLPEDLPILIGTLMRHTDDTLTVETGIYRCLKMMRYSPYLRDTCRVMREVLHGK